MKVKLITTYAGPNGTYLSGTTIDVDMAEAKTLVAGGYATLAEEPSTERSVEVETATVETPEKAVSRGKVKKKE